MARVENPIRSFSAPGRYFQGQGILERLNEYTSLFGCKAFMLIDTFFFDEYTAKYSTIFSKTGHQIKTERFCSVARQSMHSYWQNEPFYIDAQQVYNDITAANAIGKQYIEKSKAKA